MFRNLPGIGSLNIGAFKQRMPRPEDALPGRSQALPLHNVHHVLGTPMRDDFAGLQRVQFGMGCFWGAERKFWQALNQADINLELAAALDPLAPFGPGNAKPVFATHNLSLQKTDLIGRNQEHIKLTVADEAGNSQTVLWWNGKDEVLPEGRFDLAYSVRASDWRGTRQVQMEFVDFHPAEGQAIEVQAGRIEVVDYRNHPEAEAQLAFLRQHRCDSAQGFLLARPAPAEAVTALLHRLAGQSERAFLTPVPRRLPAWNRRPPVCRNP